MINPLMLIVQILLGSVVYGSLVLWWFLAEPPRTLVFLVTSAFLAALFILYLVTYQRLEKARYETIYRRLVDAASTPGQHPKRPVTLHRAPRRMD